MISIGTDCAKNDLDPLGDGDQSMIKTSGGRDKAREIFSEGGDISEHLMGCAFSEFVMNCMLGSVQGTEKAIEEAIKKGGGDLVPTSRNEELRKLLESRETSLRLSPLLMIVSAGKNLVDVDEDDQIQIAKLLLQYGANPRAQDVLGKTVCHYGAGGMATSMTLKVADICILAAKTSHNCTI